MGNIIQPQHYRIHPFTSLQTPPKAIHHSHIANKSIHTFTFWKKNSPSRRVLEDIEVDVGEAALDFLSHAKFRCVGNFVRKICRKAEEIFQAQKLNLLYNLEEKSILINFLQVSLTRDQFATRYEFIAVRIWFFNATMFSLAKTSVTM